MDDEPQRSNGNRKPAVPGALRALRTIVFGLAALLGAIGAVAFVRLPAPTADLAGSGPEARTGTAGSVAAAGCHPACVGRAGPLLTVDMLAAGLTGIAALEAIDSLPVTADRLGAESQATSTGDDRQWADSDRRSDAGRDHDTRTEDDDEDEDDENDDDRGDDEEGDG